MQRGLRSTVTDPMMADRVYLLPLNVESIETILKENQIDAVLPTMGGQTALNLAMALHARGLVGVPGTPELIGANAEAIATAEDREKCRTYFEPLRPKSWGADFRDWVRRLKPTPQPR